MPSADHATDVIEGSFRVVSTRPVQAQAWRASPNRRRAVARILVWNLALVFVVVALPYIAR